MNYPGLGICLRRPSNSALYSLFLPLASSIYSCIGEFIICMSATDWYVFKLKALRNVAIHGEKEHLLNSWIGEEDRPKQAKERSTIQF